MMPPEGKNLVIGNTAVLLAPVVWRQINKMQIPIEKFTQQWNRLFHSLEEAATAFSDAEELFHTLQTHSEQSALDDATELLGRGYQLVAEYERARDTMHTVLSHMVSQVVSLTEGLQGADHSMQLIVASRRATEEMQGAYIQAIDNKREAEREEQLYKLSKHSQHTIAVHNSNIVIGEHVKQLLGAEFEAKLRAMVQAYKECMKRVDSQRNQGKERRAVLANMCEAVAQQITACADRCEKIEEQIIYEIGITNSERREELNSSQGELAELTSALREAAAVLEVEAKVFRKQ